MSFSNPGASHTIKLILDFFFFFSFLSETRGSDPLPSSCGYISCLPILFLILSREGRGLDFYPVPVAHRTLKTPDSLER